MKLPVALLLVTAFATPLLGGCNDGAPTAAPPVTGKVSDWKGMSKEEKIATINKQNIPEAAKASAIDRINRGID